MRREGNEGLESGWGSDGTHQVESELLKLNLLKRDGAHVGPLAKLMLHPLNINMKRVLDLISLIIFYQWNWWMRTLGAWDCKIANKISLNKNHF